MEGISLDWLVLFRSHDPAIWDTDVSQGDHHLARALAVVPEDIRYLRIRKDSEFRIIEMNKLGVQNLYVMGFQTFAPPEEEIRGFRDVVFPRLQAVGLRP